MTNEANNGNERPSTYEIVAFVPYRLNALGEPEFLLQCRTDDAPADPSVMGFFGGGKKVGETVEQCLVREVEQELSIKIRKVPEKFPELISDTAVLNNERRARVMHLYYKKVPRTFEDTIMIKEGKPLGPMGSRFMSLRELIAMSKHSPHLCDPRVIKALSYLSAKLT